MQVRACGSKSESQLETEPIQGIRHFSKNFFTVHSELFTSSNQYTKDRDNLAASIAKYKLIAYDLRITHRLNLLILMW